MLSPTEIIRKKRDGQKLSQEELAYFFKGHLDGKVPDYQVSAMLMAIFFQGLNVDETAALTDMMRYSGATLNWPQYKQSEVVDKHSTGGVGDKTSLIILPLICLEKLRIPMMSGRGLGHTGGTLDKLESIPGMNVQLDRAHACKIVEQLHGVFIGQTSDLVPLDRSLYALRDVTATVESIPLITSSILSKKLAEGIGCLVMDVKFGSGAFMQDFSLAKELADSIQTIGKQCGLRIKSLLTNMNSPLGRHAGNALEVKECIEVMQGRGPSDTRVLSLALSAALVHLAKPNEKIEAIHQRLEAHLDSGKALEKFIEICVAQGADRKSLESPQLLPQAKYRLVVSAPTTGWIKEINVRQLGLAVVELGGGRHKKEDNIDPAVGLSDLKHVGEQVSQGSPLAIIETNFEEGHPQNQLIQDLVKTAYTIVPDPVASQSLIAEILE